MTTRGSGLDLLMVENGTRDDLHPRRVDPETRTRDRASGYVRSDPFTTY